MKTVRSFNPSDRYVFDFEKCTVAEGFAQVDTSQDASYFGTWANPSKLCIVNYCEGDITVNFAESDEEFVQEIRNIKQWNESQGHRFIGIDAGLGESLPQQFRDIGLGDLLH